MFKKILINLLVSAIALLMVCFVIDRAILSFSGRSIVKIPPFASDPSESPYGTGLKSNYMGRYSNAEYDITIKTNSLGMRDDKEIEFNKKKGVYRILCVGDSFTFGQGVEAEEAYPKLLEGHLISEFDTQTVEVLNAGWVASNTKSQDIFIEKYGIKFKPDLITLAFFAGNDVIETISCDMPPAEQVMFQSDYITALSLRVGSIGRFRTIFDKVFPNLYEVASLRLIKLFYRLGYHRTSFDFMLQREYPEELIKGWQAVFRHLEHIKKVCDENEIDLVVVMVPFPDQVLDVKLKKDLIRNKPQLILEEFCEEKDIDYVDLMFALSHHNKENIYYIKDGHWTRIGHEIVAEEIFKNLAGEARKNLLFFPI